MNEPLQKMLTPQLQRWLRLIAARPSAVAGACLTLTLVLLVYAFFNLGINADNLSLVSKSLKSRQNHAAFAALFPNLEEAMLVVIDGETPALAREATDALALELEAMGDTFRDVYVPVGGTFFEEHALLYRTPDELDEFADQLATLQPVLASLESDPSLVQLAELVRLGFESGNGEADFDAGDDEFGVFANAFAHFGFIAGDVQKVIRNLERQPNTLSVIRNGFKSYSVRICDPSPHGQGG